jgi:5-methylcytosine-specific restriction endonuclease McrA
MISIKLKNYNKPPKKLICPNSIKQIQRAANSQDGSICSGNYYRDDSVRSLLKAFSIGKRHFNKKDSPKCFYCESKGEAMLILEVEHYRPKDAVNKIDLAIGQKHNGYYWLANEWSNLLLSCRSCNNASAKGTRFPIVDHKNRIFHEQPVNSALILDRSNSKINSNKLISEYPLLLNPEYDVPEDHLTFNAFGRIKPKSNSKKGQITIEVLKLDRDPLRIKRKKILDDFIHDIKVLIEARDLGKFTSNENLEAALEPICKKIISKRRADSAYTLWGIYLNDNIEKLIINKLPKPYRELVKKVYYGC